MSLFKSNTAVITTFSLCFMMSATDTKAQTALSANIPEALNGTYELTFGYASSGAPYANGDKLTFVINGTNDTLCVNGKLLSNPYLKEAGGVEKFFADTASKTYYAISDKLDGSFNEINVYFNSDSNWTGQFGGSRTSTALACGNISAATTDSYTENGVTISQDMKNAFTLAANLYPGLFRTPGILREFDGYAYRYYRDTGVYIGFKDGKVYVMGGAFGNTIQQYKNSVTDVLNELREVHKTRFGSYPTFNETVVEVPKVDIPAGDFTLTISGNISFSLFGFSQSVTFPAITLQKMPAPGANDVDQIRNIIIESADLKNVKNVKVVQKENSASRVAFDIELDADYSASGTNLVASYKLQYLYVK